MLSLNFDDGVSIFIASLVVSLTVVKAKICETVTLLLPLESEETSTFRQTATTVLQCCSPYYPAFYTYLDYHGYLHTTVQYFVRNVSRIVFHSTIFSKFSYERQLVRLPDESLIAIDWAELSMAIQILNDLYISISSVCAR